VNVKWSGEHVPQSPFNVKIFNNEKELEEYLQQTDADELKNYQQQQQTTI
jgi:hypothetical protein